MQFHAEWIYRDKLWVFWIRRPDVCYLAKHYGPVLKEAGKDNLGKHSRETPFKRMHDQMDKTGLPHLDINSFPTVKAALKTELKVL